jgi:hypothetical protein
MCGRIFPPAAEVFGKSGRNLLPGVGNTVLLSYSVVSSILLNMRIEEFLRFLDKTSPFITTHKKSPYQTIFYKENASYKTRLLLYLFRLESQIIGLIILCKNN